MQGTGVIEVYGGFRLSPLLARRVQAAVTEILREDLRPDLAHAGDDCPLCKEARHDASQPDRARRLRLA